MSKLNNLFRPKLRLVKGTRFTSALFIGVSVLIAAGILWAANTYYDIDTGKIMVEEMQQITKLFQATTTEITTTDNLAALTIAQSGLGSALVATSTSSMTSTTAKITNLGSGDSLVVEDADTDATPFVIDNAGNVGIGSSTPGFVLTTAGHVVPSTDNTYALGQTNLRWANLYAATTTIGGTVTIDTDDVRASGFLTVTAQAGNLTVTSSNNLIFVSDGYLSVTSTDYLSFATADSEKMRILAGGNVGIGTSTPTAVLHIIQTAGADAFRVDDETGETTPFVVDQSGNVGVGTTTPSTNLSVQGVIIGSENLIIYGTPTSTIANSFTVDTNVLFVDSYANQVGIGTVTPDFALEVVGVGFFSTSAGFGGTATTTGTAITFDGAGNITAGAASTWQTSAGNLTIQSAADLYATSSSNIRLIASTGSIYATSSADFLITLGDATGVQEFMILDSAGSVVLRIDSDGNTTTTGDLEVQGGDISNSTGALTITSGSGGDLIFDSASGWITTSDAIYARGGFFTTSTSATIRKAGDEIVRGVVPIFGFDLPARCNTACDGQWASVSRYVQNDPFPTAYDGTTRKHKFTIRYADATTTVNFTVRIATTTPSVTSPIFVVTNSSTTDLTRGNNYLTAATTTVPTDTREWRLQVQSGGSGGYDIQIYEILLIAVDEVN